MRAYRILVVLLALSALMSGCARPEPVDKLAVALTVAAVQTRNAAPQPQPTLAPAVMPTPEKRLTQGEELEAVALIESLEVLTTSS